MSKESTFFEIHRIKRPRVMMMDTEDMSVEQVRRLMDNIPWEINPDNPLFHYNLAHRIKTNDIKRRQVMIVSTPGNEGLERLIARSKEVGSFEVVPVEWPLEPVDHALDALRRNAEAIGVSPELLASVANTETGFADKITNTNDLLRESVREFTERWAEHFRFTSKPMLSQAMFMRDIHLITTMDVKALKKSYVPTNGSMRQKKHRYQAALYTKNVERSRKILKNVYPTHIGEMKPQPDGTVLLDVVFEQGQPMDLTMDRNVSFNSNVGPEDNAKMQAQGWSQPLELAPRGFKHPDGSIEITSYDVVSKH